MAIIRPIDRWFIEQILPFERELLRAAERLCRNSEEAGDLVQDVFAKLLATDGWQAISDPRSYMLRAMRNILIDRIRRANIVDFRYIADLEDLVLADNAPDQHSVAEGKQALAEFNRALENLPERCRTVFVRRRIEGQSPARIAEDLGLSRSTLEKRLARAIFLLTQALGPRREPEDRDAADTLSADRHSA